MAAERVGITPIVRTPGFDPAFILRLLDMGVQGIQVPHVSDPETAKEAVKAVRYPPEGDRGMAAGSRAADFGKTPLLEHMARSNREILLACMIEDMAAVERIDEIAAVKGVDLLGGWAVRPVALLGGQRAPRPPAPRRGDRPGARGGEKGRRLPPGIAAQPRRLPAQRGRIEAPRRRLFELRADPGSAPPALDAGASDGAAEALLKPSLRRQSHSSSLRCRPMGPAAQGPTHHPPSTPIAWPVTKAASSEAR